MGAEAALWLWPAATRGLARALWFAAACLGPLGLAWSLLAFDPPAGPLLPVMTFAAAVASLHGAQRLLRRAARGRARIENGVLAIAAWDRVVSLPLDAIARIRPWSLAVPGAGLRIESRSGARLQLGIDEPAALLRALADAGPPALRSLVADALRRPAVADAQAAVAVRRGRRLPSRGARSALRVAIGSLIPGCAFFYTHQSIAYGGLWGEYYALGPSAWLNTFARFWLTCGVLAFVYSSLCRGVGAVLRWSATRVAPSHAARARRVAGGIEAFAYWAGVPALTALRYVA